MLQFLSPLLLLKQLMLMLLMLLLLPQQLQLLPLPLLLQLLLKLPLLPRRLPRKMALRLRKIKLTLLPSNSAHA